MSSPILLPQYGNSVESCILVAWKKQIGEAVKQGDVLCEVETDKSTIEVESPVGGVLLSALFQPGDDIPVKTVIAMVGAVDEDVEENSPSPPTRFSHVTGERGRMSPISPRARRLAAQNGVDVAGAAGTGPGGRIIERDIQAVLSAPAARITPLARAMVASGDYVAPEQGSGQGGRITRRDLVPAPPRAKAARLREEPSPLKGLSSDSQVPSADESVLQPMGFNPRRNQQHTTVEESERIPLTHIRSVIAARMLESLHTTAQFTLNIPADARAVRRYREQLKTSPDAFGLRGVTINDLILYATARTLPQFPDLNAHFETDALVRFRRVHLGFAVDTPRGLLVPVIQDAAVLSLKALAERAKALGEAAAGGKIKPDDLTGGTFTVSNLGSFGVESFTPILNPPQIAILGVGNIHLKPVETADGEVEFVPHLMLSLTVNHQAVDGAPAARFLAALAANIANIELMLAV